MIAQRESLEEALAGLEAGALAGASTIVVSRRWWDMLSSQERDGYRARAERLSVELRADDVMSAHLVEVRGGDAGPPLSSERPV